MTPLPFKPQDYCDCTLVEALDRIARRAGVVDGCFNSSTGERPSPERPWVFLYSGRLAHNRHERSELDEFLDRGPIGALLNEDEHRSRRASVKRAVGAMMAFEEAIRPLFVALEDGLLVLEGFEKTGKRAAAITTPIDSGRWAMPWAVIRQREGATVELFSDLYEDPEITFTGCRLVAGRVASSRAAGRAVASEGKVARTMVELVGTPKGKPGRKEIDDSKPLARLLEIINGGPFKYLTEAVDKLLAEGKVKVEGASKRAIYERLRGKLGENWLIKEGQEGLKLTPRTAGHGI
jgi:hypothetical protein